MDHNRINAQKDKVAAQFQNAESIIQNIDFTLANFIHRYLETNICPKPTITYPNSSLICVTSQDQDKNGQVKILNLEIYLKSIQVDRGEIELRSAIYDQESNKIADKKVNFRYQDIGYFRKHFPLALEEICEIF